jgi:hypothetical protein
VGRLGEARVACERAIALREAQVKAFPNVSGSHQGLAESVLRSGKVRRATGDAAGAAADWRRAGAIYASHPAAGGEVALFEARCHAALSGLAGTPGSGVSNAEGIAKAEKAIGTLRRAIAGGYRDTALMRIEAGLDPLRVRPDFRLMMMDIEFPTKPFAQSPAICAGTLTRTCDCAVKGERIVNAQNPASFAGT